MNRNFYIEGYDKTLTNAKSLLDLAKSASISESYGNGISLSILSAEESIKALIILSQSIDPTQKLDGVDKVFKDHKTKHAYIKGFSFLIDFFVKTLSKKYYEVAKSMEENRELFEARVKKHEYGKMMKWILDRNGKLPNLDQLLKWWEKANSDKNNGLYVNLIGNSWKSPADYSREKFDKSYNYSFNLYEYAMFSKALFTDSEMIKFYKGKGIIKG